MKRKICAIGNSYGVSIPRDTLNKLHLSPGDLVEVVLNEKTGKIIIEPAEPECNNKTIDIEFAKQVNGFINRYRPALKELAK